MPGISINNIFNRWDSLRAVMVNVNEGKEAGNNKVRKSCLSLAGKHQRERWRLIATFNLRLTQVSTKTHGERQSTVDSG